MKYICAESWTHCHITCLLTIILTPDLNSKFNQCLKEQSKNFSKLDFLLNIQQWDQAINVLDTWQTILSKKEWDLHSTIGNPLFLYILFIYYTYNSRYRLSGNSISNFIIKSMRLWVSRFSPLVFSIHVQYTYNSYYRLLGILSFCLSYSFTIYL